MKKINVLMVGVSPQRVGGMLTVAQAYQTDALYNENVNLKYVYTTTNGSAITRMMCMVVGYIKTFYHLITRPIDIVHIHMAEKGSTFRKGGIAKISKSLFHKQVIIHLHAGPFMSWFKSCSVSKQNKIIKIFNSADKVIVLGHYWKIELGEIIDSNKLIVIHNGVPCSENNSYNPNSRNIVYFGVMTKAKGIYDLIDAIELIDTSLPRDTKVILCGNDLEGNIEEVIAKKKLTSRFILAGWVSGEDKEKVFSNAMIDVLPSYFEGLSMTILEGMAHGIPVITTNISTMPELLGKDGILVAPGDVKHLSEELLRLNGDSTSRARMSESEFKRVREMFSQRCMIDKTLELYESLLKRS